MKQYLVAFWTAIHTYFRRKKLHRDRGRILKDVSFAYKVKKLRSQGHQFLFQSDRKRIGNEVKSLTENDVFNLSLLSCIFSNDWKKL